MLKFGFSSWRESTDMFWREAFAIRGSVTSRIILPVLTFALIALVVCELNEAIHPELGVDVAPYEVAGAALGLLLVLRTNAGYDRWWEGRKLWGGIVNQSRTLAIMAVTQGPDDPVWRDQLLRWIIAFAHVTRHSLRAERSLPKVADLLGEAETRQIAEARHMPTAVSMRIARLLRDAADARTLDRFAFLNAEEARNRLMDHVGGCERILKSPLPKVYGINIRQFILLFLTTLPFALLPKIGWLTPIATALVAYPILSLDRIGVELQNPFDLKRVGYLPLDEITTTIEADLLALLDDQHRPVSTEPKSDRLS